LRIQNILIYIFKGKSEEKRPQCPMRQLTSNELSLLKYLLSASFNGNEALLKQLNSLSVTDILEIDKTLWGLRFQVNSSDKASVDYSVPVSMSANYQEEPIELLLHVKAGVLCELELVRYGDVKMKQLPSFTELSEIKITTSDAI
jgi:hypothetical protein